MSRKLSLALVAAALVVAACSPAPTGPSGPDAPARFDDDPPPDTIKKCGGMLGSGTVVPC
jgi:ABC-type glycerol-3-phosphate transport system substrate-binding protein